MQIEILSSININKTLSEVREIYAQSSCFFHSQNQNSRDQSRNIQILSCKGEIYVIRKEDIILLEIIEEEKKRIIL